MTRKRTNSVLRCIGMLGAACLLLLLGYWTASPSLIGIISSFLFLFYILRYGWNWAFLYLAVFSALSGAAWYVWKGDAAPLANAIKGESWREVIVAFFLAVLCGAALPKQRAAELPFYEEQTSEAEELLSAFANQEKKTKELETALLKAETLRKLDQILVQDETERTINECVRFLHQQFHIKQVGVYHLDSSRKAMRIKVRMGTTEVVPQTLFFEKAPAFYERLMEEKRVIVKKTGDGEEAPLLAAPFCINGRVEQILVIREIPSYRSSSYNIESLCWLVETMREYYERALHQNYTSSADEMYSNTRVYRMEPFRKWVGFEREREEMFQQPFTCIGMYIRGLHHYKLPQVSRVLIQHLREPDKIAYDEYTQMLYILLPGTEREAANLIRKRIDALLKEHQLAVVSCTMLQNGIAM